MREGEREEGRKVEGGNRRREWGNGKRDRREKEEGEWEQVGEGQE